jgi:anti-sigma factor RsiW
MKCEEIRESLPAYVKGGEASLGVKRHLSRCRECSAELARYQSLSNALGALETTPLQPPPDLARVLKAIPHEQSRVDMVRAHMARNRSVYLGGAAVAVAGAAGAVLWRSRRSQPAVARV